jgi:hypothetical protein
MREIHISRNDLRLARVVDIEPAPLADGAARLRLDLFALTSNNVTYAAMGEGALGYWDFFPGPAGWGRLPVWGFATVAQSNAAGVDVGARYYGFFPISETLDVIPIKVGPRGFSDGASHRVAKAPVYNQYVDVAADPAYDPMFEPEQTLFRPLYATGWWIGDRIRQDHARTVVISSASSKTAIATAHSVRRNDVTLVALTSARNLTFVRECGLYDRTLAYEEAPSLTAAAPAVYVDFLGRESLTAVVHRILDAGLARSIVIGATDWDDKPGGVQPPSALVEGPTPEFFFAPAYAAARLKAQPELGAAMQRDLRGFYAASRTLVVAQRLAGAQAILASWARLTAGEMPPQQGLVLSF